MSRDVGEMKWEAVGRTSVACNQLYYFFFFHLEKKGNMFDL
jgi:hypothetical protein